MIKIALMTIALITASTASADPKIPTEKATAGGKIHIVNIEQGSQFFSYVLRDVKACPLEGLTFLCGVQLEDSWLAGKRVMLPSASIRSIYEFDSPDDYRESLKQMQANAAKPQPN